MVVFVSAGGRYLTALHCVIRQKVWKKRQGFVVSALITRYLIPELISF